jgi:hypothetical protein
MAPGNGGPIWAGGPSIPATFTDGLSQTLLVVEAGEAVPWTKPDDIPFDEKKPVPPLGGDFGFGFHAAMGDASVLFIRNTIDQQLLKWLIMPADGNVIDWDKVPVIGRGVGRSSPAEGAGESAPVKVTPPPANAVPPAGEAISRSGVRVGTGASRCGSHASVPPTPTAAAPLRQTVQGLAHT